MLRNTTICAGMLGMALHAAPAIATESKSTNDDAVTYRWTVEDTRRPFCIVRVDDANPDQHKHVSISYRNQAGSRIDLTVRMNAGEPRERLISGCVRVDQVRIARR